MMISEHLESRYIVQISKGSAPEHFRGLAYLDRSLKLNPARTGIVYKIPLLACAR